MTLILTTKTMTIRRGHLLKRSGSCCTIGCLITRVLNYPAQLRSLCSIDELTCRMDAQLDWHPQLGRTECHSKKRIFFVLSSINYFIRLTGDGIFVDRGFWQTEVGLVSIEKL